MPKGPNPPKWQDCALSNHFSLFISSMPYWANYPSTYPLTNELTNNLFNNNITTSLSNAKKQKKTVKDEIEQENQGIPWEGVCVRLLHFLGKDMLYGS